MLHKRPAQRADGTGWHYVFGMGAGGTPIGYCAEHEPHPTEHEARECYAAYLREKTIKLHVGTGGWTSCQGRSAGVRCPNPTQEFARYGDDGYGMVPLCRDHMTVEQVVEYAHLDSPAGDAWIS
jgi:hypothetical protein